MIITQVRAVVLGVVGACVAIAFFAVLSEATLSRDRLVQVVTAAFARDELQYAARTNEDFFTECAMLEMQYLRRDGLVPGAIDTKFLMVGGQHPCQSLRTMALGSPAEKAALPTAVSYFNYPFGSRHLEAIVLSVLEYREATLLYRLLAYGSLALLFGVMLRRLPATALVLAPIPLLLATAFALHRFGGNLAHAPGYFIGLFALAGFVGKRELFRDLAMRLGFSAALGVVAGYFDMLNGVIPTLLALTILLNHFFYVAPGRARVGYLSRAAAQAAAIFGCFLLAYAVLTLSRLGLLWLLGSDISAFARNLAFRTGNELGSGPITLGMIAAALFSARFQLTSGGANLANWFFLLGISGWMAAGLIGLITLLYRRAIRIPALVDGLVLAAVSVGVLSWYWRFAAHTFVHVLFMVRLVALPLAMGIAAALCAVRESRHDRLPTMPVLLSIGAAGLLAALAMHDLWPVGLAPSAIEARFVDTPADLVGCAPLGSTPDGQPDRVVEIRIEKGRPPLAYFGMRSEGLVDFQVLRREPVGVYETGSANRILGMAETPGGALLNRPDGSMSISLGGEQRVYAHFCRDGNDEPGSVYELKVDGTSTPIAPR